MDGLEDQRALSDLETAFKALVKDHLASLLESKRIYWKQRNTVRWVKQGDENTHFFHTMAVVGGTTPDTHGRLHGLRRQGWSSQQDEDLRCTVLLDVYRKTLRAIS